jgi:uncharacterized membrane protein
MKKWTTLMLARAGVIAALYVVLTFACLPVASGAIQFRISEMLTILPLFYVEAIPALFVGCLISNLISGATAWDIFLGSLITLIAAFATYGTGKFFKLPALRVSIGGFFPVALNALGLPAIWILAGATDLVYWLEVGYLTLSQGVIIWLFGSLLYYILQKLIRKNIPAIQPFSRESVNQSV